jgi:hypothetical protein
MCVSPPPLGSGKSGKQLALVELLPLPRLLAVPKARAQQRVVITVLHFTPIPSAVPRAGPPSALPCAGGCQEMEVGSDGPGASFVDPDSEDSLFNRPPSLEEMELIDPNSPPQPE